MGHRGILKSVLLISIGKYVSVHAKSQATITIRNRMPCFVCVAAKHMAQMEQAFFSAVVFTATLNAKQKISTFRTVGIIHAHASSMIYLYMIC